MQMKQYDPAWNEEISRLLQVLGVPLHRNGYYYLGIGVPKFREDPTQSLCKELYPYIASQIRCTGSTAVEHAIRESIRAAWENRKPEVWRQYFPESETVPTNKLFIATLAERLK